MIDLDLVDDVIDVTGERCPLTYVYTKLALERLPSGDILTVYLQGNAAVSNVPRSVREDGHDVVLLECLDLGIHKLQIRRK